MLKKTITYDDFDGNEQTEDFYFNISKAEIVEMMADVESEYADLLTRIGLATSNREMVGLIKKLILKAYGKKSPDGKSFVKSDRLSAEFASTEAYSSLFMEMLTNEGMAAEFMNNIVPKALVPQMQEYFASARDVDKVEPPMTTPRIEDVPLPLPDEAIPVPGLPEPVHQNIETPVVPTDKPVTEMTLEELDAYRARLMEPNA